MNSCALPQLDPVDLSFRFPLVASDSQPPYEQHVVSVAARPARRFV